jgi:hypothetical protein
MKTKGLVLLLLSLVLGWPCLAETIHLRTGEVIRGKVIRMDEQSVSVESEKGFGVIQIAKSDITTIEYDAYKRDPSRLAGIGYFHRATPNTSQPTAEYGVDSISFKYWMTSRDAVNLMLGMYSASQNGQALLDVFSMDARYASVFQRRINLDLYYGLGIGYLNVKDTTLGNNINGSGTSLRVFLGAEMFFVTFPNLGIAAEMGFGTQTVAGHTVTNFSSTPFPTFAAHYYF